MDCYKFQHCWNSSHLIKSGVKICVVLYLRESLSMRRSPYLVRSERYRDTAFLSLRSRGARICKHFKEPRNPFPAWRTDTTTLFVVLARHSVVGKMTTFDLWPLPLGGGAWGAGTNMGHPETPASYESLPTPLATQIPTLWVHISEGRGRGGALILGRCRAFDLFASVDAHLCPPGYIGCRNRLLGNKF